MPLNRNPNTHTPLNEMKRLTLCKTLRAGKHRFREGRGEKKTKVREREREKWERKKISRPEPEGRVNAEPAPGEEKDDSSGPRSSLSRRRVTFNRNENFPYFPNTRLRVAPPPPFCNASIPVYGLPFSSFFS